MKKFSVNEFLEKTHEVVAPGRHDEDAMLKLRRKVKCADGYSVSIQASCFHYCSPRSSIKGTEYTSVELGYPSTPDELINDYAEGSEYTNTVYGCVPVEIVEKLLEKHGGVVA